MNEWLPAEVQNEPVARPALEAQLDVIDGALRWCLDVNPRLMIQRIDPALKALTTLRSELMPGREACERFGATAPVYQAALALALDLLADPRINAAIFLDGDREKAIPVVVDICERFTHAVMNGMVTT